MKIPQPRFTKYKNMQKCKINVFYNFKRKSIMSLYNSHFIIKAAEFGFIRPKQILSARAMLRKGSRKFLKVWTRVFPNFQKTKKPSEIRMGRGKGSMYGYVARVKAGTVLFEFLFNKNIFKSPFLWIALVKKALYKLPIKTKIFQN